MDWDPTEWEDKGQIKSIYNSETGFDFIKASSEKLNMQEKKKENSSILFFFVARGGIVRG